MKWTTRARFRLAGEKREVHPEGVKQIAKVRGLSVFWFSSVHMVCSQCASMMNKGVFL